MAAGERCRGFIVEGLEEDAGCVCEAVELGLDSDIPVDIVFHY